jgi:3-hydroxyisobutyrate dehydrogenase-like beta-hydroxyacid dehydrogenase
MSVTVAFLGLGTMGAPMAMNLLRRGHRVVVWNRDANKAVPLVEAGARAESTPAEAARGAEMVITMLSDPAAVEAVWAGSDGILEGLAASAIAIDMSTVDPETARALSARVRERGAAFVDAPVSGSRKPAVEGKLVIMAGGDEETIERARPMLEAMGRVVRVGGVGQGMAMKLVLNGLGAHMMTAFASMLVFGVKHGLDPRAMVDVILEGAFSSPLYAVKAPKIFARDFSPDFTLALMLKDQELVLKTAGALNVPLPSLTVIRDLLAEAVAAGFGDGDLCGVIRLFEAKAGGM